MKQIPHSLILKLVLLVVWNILLIYNLDFFFIKSILSIFILFHLSGNTLLNIFKIRINPLLEKVTLSLGLSIAFVMFSGLIVNSIYLYFNYSEPLSLNPLLIFFDLAIIFLVMFEFYNNRKDTNILCSYSTDRIDKIFLLFFTSIPVLSIFGAQVLNNRGGNGLTQLMIVLILICSFAVILFKKYVKSWHYSYLLLMSGIALLLSFSLRSNHIIGFDIHEEYRLYELTKNHMFWSMILSPQNQYNACISITILPTIISVFTQIPDEYIFKFFNQIVFAFTPVLLFFASRKRNINCMHSFLIGFFFLSQVWFMLQMPELNRQEYALFFFALIIYTLFGNISILSNKILFILFGASLIISHYSTAYILLIILLIYYILSLALHSLKKNYRPLLNIYLLLILFFITFLWNFQFTKTSNSLISVAKSSWKNMVYAFNYDMLLSGTDRILFNKLNINSQQNLNKTYILASNYYNVRFKTTTFLYNEQDLGIYTPLVKTSEIIYPKVNRHIVIITYNFLNLNKIIIVDILVFVGIFSYLITKKKNNLSNNYVLICLSALPLVFGILFIPFLKINYNIERVYMQVLILTSTYTVLGAIYVFNKIKRNLILVLFIFGSFFLQSTSLLNLYIGGVPYLNLNNFGDGYNKYYTTDDEIYSARWLSKNNNSGMIYADEVASLKLKAYGNITDIRHEIFPSTITKSSYVYLDNTNIRKSISYIRYNIDLITFTTPINFLSSKKNLIYSSGGSLIYK